MDQYWASVTDDVELLSTLEKKINDYHEDLRTTGLLALYGRAYRAYYGGRVGAEGLGNSLFDGSKLSQGGEAGQKTRLKANHYRNLVQHWIQLVTSQRRSLQARSRNSDYKSQAQTILANGLLDYYYREKGIEPILKRVVETAFAIYGEAFVHSSFNTNTGRMVDAPTIDGAAVPQFEGDMEYHVLNPIDTIRDTHKKDESLDWVVLRFQRNKWDIIAENPAAVELLMAISHNDQERSPENRPEYSVRGGVGDNNSDDKMYEYVLYHNKTPALPEGRMVKFVKDVKLFDGPLPYSRIPIRQFKAAPLEGTPYGFTLAWDLLSIQGGIDELHTVLMSNNKTFGTQSIWSKKDDAPLVEDIGTGLKLYQSEEMPVALQLTKSAPESYNYLSILETTQEKLSGIPATVRGNPEANLRTGNALALVVSQALQFASGGDEALSHLLEGIGIDLIETLRDFTPASVPRSIHIVGKSNRSITKEFFSKDLDTISRVIVEQVNPLSKTIAGRVEMANNMLQQGLIKSTEDYQQVLATGQLDSVLEGDHLESLAIQSENEDLKDGKPVQAVLTENHPLHIKHHKAVISDPESKKDPVLVQNTLAHIMEHLNLMRQMPPDLLMILGIPAGYSAPQLNQTGGEGSQPVQPVQSTPEITDTQLPDMPEGSPEEAQKSYDSFKGSL